jgi:hypothetical protein
MINLADTIMSMIKVYQVIFKPQNGWYIQTYAKVALLKRCSWFKLLKTRKLEYEAH